MVQGMCNKKKILYRNEFLKLNCDKNHMGPKKEEGKLSFI